MVTTKICERCEKEMKLIPAGFSKAKNKAYSAFWACDRRSGGCGSTAKAEGTDAEAAPNQSNGGSFAQYAPSPDRLDRIESKLDDIIRLLQAK